MGTQSLSLCEKYRPLKIADFIGLTEPKKILQKMAVHLNCRALLFEGKSGSGKTAMAWAFAAEIHAQVHELSAHECTRDKVARLCITCQCGPKAGFRMHLILVDQADTLNKRQQSDLRSQIDGPELLDNVIWVFTATPTTKLEPGFRSRCVPLKFSTYGNSSAAADLLERVWQAEAHTVAPPNFVRIVKEANGNMRTALTEIELKLAGARSEVLEESPLRG